MPHKPKLGQNFLVDDAARHAIVDALGDISQRTVIEIGPGHGALTEILAGRARGWGWTPAVDLSRALSEIERAVTASSSIVAEVSATAADCSLAAAAESRDDARNSSTELPSTSAVPRILESRRRISTASGPAPARDRPEPGRGKPRTASASQSRRPRESRCGNGGGAWPRET